MIVYLQAVMMSPLREKGITKQGYLTKAPFHGESNGTPGAKVCTQYKHLKYSWTLFYQHTRTLKSLSLEGGGGVFHWCCHMYATVCMVYYQLGVNMVDETSDFRFLKTAERGYLVTCM